MRCTYLAVVVMFEIVRFAVSRITQDPSDLAVSPNNKEPTCEELRTMWRHTKREMQQQTERESTPVRFEPRYHEPVAFGVMAKARPRNAMYSSKAVYGRVVHSPDKFMYRSSAPNRYRSFDQLVRLIGTSPNHFPLPLTTQQKPVYFRLDFPTRKSPLPRRKPMSPFQELKNVLRNDRAAEQKMMKLKEETDGTGLANSDFRDESESSRYDTYRFPQSSEDDVTAVNTRGRKLRGTGESSSDPEGYAENADADETGSLHSTSKPVSTDDSIPRRWALGWKR